MANLTRVAQVMAEYTNHHQMSGWLIAGGGLAGSLLAARLRVLAPELRVTVIEQGRRIGGSPERTWSFFGTDLSPGQATWVRPLVERTWDGYEVRFPRYNRELRTPYHSVRSDSFHDNLEPMLGRLFRFGTKIREVGPDHVILDDGTTLQADVVIDARGWEPVRNLRCGFQKFTGIDFRLERPHGLTRPLVMDATVEQNDGFRFVYLIPWSPTEILVEDTRYSDSPALDPERDSAANRAYARARGWEVSAEIRRESGVLPVPTRPVETPEHSVASIGLRGGFYHPTTSYSLPLAARLADELARLAAAGRQTTESVRAHVAALARRHRASGAYARFLNRMLFEAAAPERRHLVLQRFYGLPEPLIERFYAGTATWPDRVRILAGKPPVPVLRAMRCLLPAGGSLRSGDMEVT